MKSLSFVTNILCLVFVVLQSLAIIPDTYLNHIVFALWLVFMVGTSPVQFKKALSQPKYLALFVFVFFYFCSATIAANPVIAFHRTFTLLEVLLPILLFDLSQISKKSIPTKWLILSFSVVIVVNTIIASQTIELTQGYGLRLTATDMVVKNNFALVYSLAILCPVLLYFLLTLLKKNERITKAKKTVILLLIITALFFFIKIVFQSYFMTAVILLLSGIVIALFYGRKYWLLKSGVLIALLLIAFIGSFNKLVSFTDSQEGLSSQVSPKLYEIHAILTGQARKADDYSARQSLSQSSLDTFLENLLFGVYHKAYDFEEIEKMGVGNHAEWFDILARYGIFGFLLLFFLFKTFWHSYKATKFGLHLLLFVLLGFLNPLFGFFQLFTICVYIPFLYKVLISYEQ